ncbi:MAG TPA: hypothetical protein VMT99_01550 [Candidatus Paceibacterota bacterium]|nr:hypothetical protein [Candidatus Paceibacterota bacterium]
MNEQPAKETSEVVKAPAETAPQPIENEPAADGSDEAKEQSASERFEARERERQQALEAIKASMFGKGGAAPTGAAARTEGAPSPANHVAAENGTRAAGGDSKLLKGIGTGFKIIGGAIQLGFMLALFGVARMLERPSKAKAEKGGGHAKKSGHEKKNGKGHAAAHGGGGHATKDHGHGGGGGHH